MEPVRVSIVVPVYNTGNYLKNASIPFYPRPVGILS